MKIWVIEEGEYSDYRVVGVFSTRENAEFIQKRVGGEISEWEMDPGVDALRSGMSRYRVLMLRDGTVESVEACGGEICGYDLAALCRVWRRSTAPFYKGKGVPDCADASIWATDEKHAIKIANEHRARLIADGAWD